MQFFGGHKWSFRLKFLNVWCHALVKLQKQKKEIQYRENKIKLIKDMQQFKIH